MANPIVDALGPFIWGAGGAKKTPEEIARDKEVAADLLMKAGNTSPVQHWSQGAARVVDALGGVIKQRRAEAAGAENATYNEGIIKSLLSGGATASNEAGATAPYTTSTAGAQSADVGDLSGNDVFSGFMDTVKAGGVQNPYALAAIAATGKAESGFDPGNVNRTWSDPSQSGQAGRAGGIMSWRGPRYEALAATGDLSPQGQAKFFLQEDPKLIERLNGAKSVEEAQSLMNRAWAFAGYDKPGGEAARRMALASSFAPQFQGQAAPTQVASIDPSAGMAQPQTAAQAIEAQAPSTGNSLSDEVAAFRETPEYAAQFPGRQPQPIQADPAVAAQPAQSPAPVEVAGGGGRPSVFEQPQAAPQAAPSMNEALVRAITDPRASAQTKAVAQALMQQQMAQQQAEREMRLKQADPAYRLGLEKSQLEIDNLRNPRLSNADKLAREKFDLEKGQQGRTPDINEYEYAKKQGFEGSFSDFILSQKKAGAANTTINNGEGNKFYNTLDEKNATTISGLSETGMQARAKMGQIDQLEKLMTASPTGAVAALKQAAGEYGINTEGLNDLQAATALIQQLVPQQRAPGSGSMSDADLALFKQSLPRLINQPGGNQTILNTMRGITQYQIKTGEIADRIANREITPAEGRSAIAQLPNPLSNFKPPEAGKESEGWRELSPGIRIRKVQ